MIINSFYGCKNPSTTVKSNNLFKNWVVIAYVLPFCDKSNFLVLFLLFQKRRKSSIVMTDASGVSLNKDEPSVKKNVKCGVCQKLLAEEDWGEHCDTSHCSIAWRSGETIVSTYLIAYCQFVSFVLWGD